LLAVVLFAAVMQLLFIPKQADASDKMLYWNDGSGAYYRANLDGTGFEPLSMLFGYSVGFAIDSTASKMYWTEISDPGRIRRANLDGSNTEDVLIGLRSPKGISIDSVNNRMCWVDWEGVAWSNLDGSNVNYIFPTGFPEDYPPTGIALNSADGKVYLADPMNGNIKSCNLDGSQYDLFPSFFGVPYGLALDSIDSKIYWTESSGYIGCANLDGSNRQSIWVGGDLNYGIALDNDNGKIYWSGADGYYSYIRCANLDGSNIDTILSLEQDHFALTMAIGPVPEPATLLLLGLGAVILRKKN
jgi:hypothetical protein